MDDTEVSLVVLTTVPVIWTVEAVNSDGDGGIETAQFTGPHADRRAREYSAWKYGVGDPPVIAS